VTPSIDWGYKDFNSVEKYQIIKRGERIMGSLWEDIKKTVKQGVSVAAEKTEEYTKIGKLKVEIMNMKRNLDKTFAELGQEAYTNLKGLKKGGLTKNEKITELLSKIDDQKAALKGKEDEIEALRQEDSSQSDETPETEVLEKSKDTKKKKK